MPITEISMVKLHVCELGMLKESSKRGKDL